MYSVVMHSEDSQGKHREEILSVVSTSPKGVLLARHGSMWWVDWINLEKNGVDLLLDGVPVEDGLFDLAWGCKRGIKTNT